MNILNLKISTVYVVKIQGGVFHDTVVVKASDIVNAVKKAVAYYKEVSASPDIHPSVSCEATNLIE